MRLEPIIELPPFESVRASLAPVSSAREASPALALLDPRALGQVFTPPDMAALLVELAGISAGWRGTVLDPACGPGALLLAVLEAVGRTPPALDTEPTPTALRDCTLWGIELDETLLARAAAALTSGVVTCRLQQGNALSFSAEVAGQCDVVLANPPYVAWHRITSGVRAGLDAWPWQLLPGRPHHADQQPDLALFFLLLGWMALKPGGRLVYLMSPEWLSAPRIASFRDWFLSNACVEALLSFGAQVPVFEGDAGEVIQTGAMLLVATKTEPDPAHSLVWAQLESWGEARPLTLRRLGAEICAALGRPTPGPPPVLPALPGACASLTRVPQTALRGRSWQLTPVRAVPSSWIALGDIPGVRVVGGHQPRVQWLQWLTLDADAYAGLPVSEQRWLAPALQEAREIHPPIQPAPSRYWLMLPAGWTELEFQQRAPGRYACIRAKLLSVSGGMAEPEALPDDWWHFPNPRNLPLFETGLPGLLLPRTAAQLQATWDAHGHQIKGTNTAIRPVDARQVWRLEALFGLLNSQPMRELCLQQTRSYHGRGIRLEPRDVSALRLPPLDSTVLKADWAALRAVVRRILVGQSSLQALNAPAHQLLQQAT